VAEEKKEEEGNKLEGCVHMKTLDNSILFFCFQPLHVMTEVKNVPQDQVQNGKYPARRAVVHQMVHIQDLGLVQGSVKVAMDFLGTVHNMPHI